MPRTRKTEKLSITLPKELASELRALVPRGRLSSFIAEAADFYLAWRRQKEALEIGYGAWKGKNHPELKTPEDTTAYVRSLRDLDNERLDLLEGGRGEQ